MKHKRILAAALLLALAGFILWRMAAFPKLRAERESYPLSAQSISFVLETGARSVSCSPSGYGGWFERATGNAWERIEADPEANFLLTTVTVLPFSRSLAVDIGLDAWPVAEAGPGTYRFVLSCHELPLFGNGRGDEILLTSQPFRLQ